MQSDADQEKNETPGRDGVYGRGQRERLLHPKQQNISKHTSASESDQRARGQKGHPASKLKTKQHFNMKYETLWLFSVYIYTGLPEDA